MDFQLVTEIYYYVIINISYILLFIYNQLMDKEIFSILVTTYIGVTALIIALGIFVMDKGDIDKRNIFKITLIRESNIEGLIKKTITVFLLILIQFILSPDIFPFSFLVFIIRILIFCLIIEITYIIKESFIKIIKIITNEEEKENYIKKTFENNIRNLISNDNKLNIIKQNSKTKFIKVFSDKDYISYDSDYILDWANEYNYLYPDEDGVVVNLNIEKLKELNEKIKIYIQTNNKQYKFINASYCIIKKISGEKLKKEEIVIYIRKELEDITIRCNDFYEIKPFFAQEKKIIENQIIDVCQIYLDNINQKNIYGIKKSKAEFSVLYRTLIKENASDFFGLFYENIKELSKNYKNTVSESLISICFELSYIAQVNNLKNEFENYYYLYFILRIENADNNEIELLFQNLENMKKHINRNEKIKEKKHYFEIILHLKQLFFKYLLENKKYGEISKRILNFSIYNNIYFLNSYMDDIIHCNKRLKEFKDLEIEKSKKDLITQYYNEFIELNNNNIVLLNIAELSLCKWRKENNKNGILGIFKIILNYFEAYNVDDIIEIYIVIKNEDNVLLTWAKYWFESGFNIDEIIYLVLFKSNITDNKKLIFKSYINKKNIHYFETLKNNINKIDNEQLIFLELIREQYEQKAKKISDYLQIIIEKCNKEDK